MKNTMRMLAMLLMTLCLLIPLTGCGDGQRKAEVEDLLTRFEEACSAMDVDAALDCIEPRKTAPVKAVRGMLDRLFGETDLSGAFFELLGKISGNTLEEPADFFGDMHIEVGRVRADSKKASVNAVVTCDVAGRQIVRDAQFRCVYDVGRWYISDFSLK